MHGSSVFIDLATLQRHEPIAYYTTENSSQQGHGGLPKGTASVFEHTPQMRCGSITGNYRPRASVVQFPYVVRKPYKVCIRLPSLESPAKAKAGHDGWIRARRARMAFPKESPALKPPSTGGWNVERAQYEPGCFVCLCSATS